MLSGAIVFLTFGVEAVIFCALFATFVAPFFAIAVLGPDRRKSALLLLSRPMFAPRVRADPNPSSRP
jgi:Flp pilus assembly protein protease CpaA